jgi:hypothetical protein
MVLFILGNISMIWATFGKPETLRDWTFLMEGIDYLPSKRRRTMTDFATIAIPSVHMNGTSKRELLDQYIAAIRALRNATEIMAKGGPHGRDYYVQGSDAINVAIAQHRVRLQKVNAVADELEAIALEVQSQGKD